MPGGPTRAAGRSAGSLDDAQGPGRALIVHGYGATVDSHWFPWLAARLQAAGTPTAIVRLPAPDAPDAGEWDRAVAEAVGVPDRRTTLIGHSLGCVSLLRHLGSLERGWALRSLVLVSGFLEPLPGLPELDAFTVESHGLLALDRVADAVDRRSVVRSDADPIVAPEASDRLAAALRADLVVVPGGGHFLDEAGWTEFPELLDRI